MFFFLTAFLKNNYKKKSYRHCFCIVPNTTWFLPPNVWVFTFLKLFFFLCSLLISGLTFKCFKVFIVLLFYPPPFLALCVEPTWTGPRIRTRWSPRMQSLRTWNTLLVTFPKHNHLNVSDSAVVSYFIIHFWGWTFELWLPTCVTFLPPPSQPTHGFNFMGTSFVDLSEHQRELSLLKINILLNLVLFCRRTPVPFTTGSKVAAIYFMST